MTSTRTGWLGYAVVGSGAAFGLLGACASFGTVNETMQPSFGAGAWMVPVGMDLGIAVGTAGDLWMAAQNKRTWWLRYIPHGLSLATVYLNVVGESTLEGRVAHAVLVFLWIAFVAAIAHVVKLEAVGRRERKHLDRIRTSRWLLAPLSSTWLRREMVLNEQPSYSDALEARNARRLARAELRDRHGGRGWRRKLSHVDRERYRQGSYELVPQPVPLPAAPLPLTSRTNGHRPAELAPAPPRPAPASSNGNSRDVDEAARLIYDRETAAGRPLSDRSLIRLLKEADPQCAIGRPRARRLLAEFASEVES